METQRSQKNNQRKTCKNRILQKKIPIECTKTISRKKQHIKKARKLIKYPIHCVILKQKRLFARSD